MRKFEYFAPQSLSEAFGVFQAQDEGGRALAGGTGDCGACSTIVHGKLITSCLVLAPEADAIANAVGTRLYEVPAKPERILEALRKI